MGNRTPLYDKHIAAGAKMVDFGGWDMPIRYGSQIEEHHQVRRDAGMFDVSHMVVSDLRGPDVRDFLRYLLANDIGRLKKPGKALYSCMLNEHGGVIDDLITYYMTDDWFRLVTNAATHEKDMNWIRQLGKEYDVSIKEPVGLAIIAIQGPNALERFCATQLPSIIAQVKQLTPFNAFVQGEMFVARTGYTGEDGIEVVLPAAQAQALWDALLEKGVRPIGLGARDTLRLEAGMNLYGADMDEQTSPLVSALGWTVAWEPEARDFIGRKALETEREMKPASKLVGLVLEGKGVLRNQQKVIVAGLAEGEITSGSFSPTLGKAIAFARVPGQTGSHCKVDIRGRQVDARVITPPFVRNGKSCIE